MNRFARRQARASRSVATRTVHPSPEQTTAPASHAASASRRAAAAALRHSAHNRRDQYRSRTDGNGRPFGRCRPHPPHVRSRNRFSAASARSRHTPHRAPRTM
ncbi:hypothetical protein ACIG5E_34230 [Kitasatospora sp. NPDC053057]|uniref:hypothetical protein n=1 Tax=Kitasatospora sp. NPDC053057 TaxID=3364062 RepID=UPI0037CB4FF8